VKSNIERFARLAHTLELCVFGRPGAPGEGSQT
jgi:hypothetical protein